MDLGAYERFLDRDLNCNNFITSGKIYQKIIEKERKGEYLGRDVQFIPHLTGETKLVFRNLAVESKADVVLIEVGGTVGDYENLFALEALRQLRYEEGEENVCFVNLTYILEPSNVGEFKSKAAQLGIKKLIEIGIQPDIVICRSERPIPDSIKEKISLNANVPLQYVFGLHNVDSIYELPLYLRKINLAEAIFDTLNIRKLLRLPDKVPIEKWTNEMIVKEPKAELNIAIAGKYTGVTDSYISILKALEHCEASEKLKINVGWVETTQIEKGEMDAKKVLKKYDGLIVPGGFGARGAEGKIKCVNYARKNKIPYLGLCFGFQMAVIEFARNVAKLQDASSTEITPDTEQPVICILPEQEEIEGLGGTLRLGGYDVIIKKDTFAHKLYGKEKVRERFRHRFNVNTKYIDTIEDAGLEFSGYAPEKRIMQVLELKNHPFFVGTQFHPEFTSRPLKPNPIYRGFVKACFEKSK